MKVLATGFGPFGDIEHNPSQQVVDELERRLTGDGEIELVTEVLPVEFKAAGDRIEALIRRNLPDLVLSIGVAASRKEISLERVALNLDDCTQPDNAGHCPQGVQIAPGAPAAYFSQLPLIALRDELISNNIPAVISNHAGTFVCNHVLYCAAHLVHTSQLPVRHGFVHVPLLRTEGTGGKAPMALSKAVEAVIHLVRRLSQTD